MRMRAVEAQPTVSALGDAHDVLARWARKNSKRPRGGAWEVYVTDPGCEPDPQKWESKIFLPIV